MHPAEGLGRSCKNREKNFTKSWDANNGPGWIDPAGAAWRARLSWG
jgi:hypothetical protein